MDNVKSIAAAGEKAKAAILKEKTVLLIEFGEVLLLGVPGVFGVGIACNG